MPSFDPQQRKSYPDIEARIIHDITERPGSDQEIQHVYLIKKVPDGDLILESSIRDLTQINIMESMFDELEESEQGEEEVALIGLMACQAGRDAIIAEMKAIEEEKKLGLHDSSQQDIEDITQLLSEAKPFH
jgi:hypothetical protein